MFRLKRSEIDTGHFNVVFVNRIDAQNLGLFPTEKVEIYSSNDKTRRITARVNILDGKSNGSRKKIPKGYIALSNKAFDSLGLKENDSVNISSFSIVKSFDKVKEKWEGETLSREDFKIIIDDISKEKYESPHITYFLLACQKSGLSYDEIASLTLALVEAGKTLKIDSDIVVDKHCIGGIPNNRTTPIIVPIIASYGIKIPNTFTKAITTSAATADVVGTFMNVEIGLDRMKEIVEKTNGCLVWGGALDMAPGDDILIQVSRPLNIDSRGQMIASILSKKMATNLTHLLIDIPYGKEAKAVNLEDANELKKDFEEVSKILGLNLKVVITNGENPIGRGIGPIAEMMDVLSVLKNEKDCPKDLKENAIYLASELINFAEKRTDGEKIAREILESGKAYEKFMEIRKEQGEIELGKLSKYSLEVRSEVSGEIKDIDNNKIKKINRIAGAPFDLGSAIILERNFNDGKGKVSKGDLLFTVFSSSKEKLELVKDYIKENGNSFEIVIVQYI